MSKDIRSYFSIMPKKSTAEKKPKRIIDSDDDDIISSPTPKKNLDKNKKRKLHDSDSDDGNKKVKKKVKSKEEFKAVNALDMFGSTPVKQKIVEKGNKKDSGRIPKKHTGDTKKNNEDAFSKTLQQLDDDFPIDVDVLDKTIDEAMNADPVVEKSSSNSEAKTPKRGLSSEGKTPKSGTSSEGMTPNKRRKVEEDLNNSGMDPDEERHERRRHSAMLYQKYLHRGKPAHKGQKELPQGKPDCLKNLCFLKTGVLDSLEHDDFDALIKEHGGRTVNSLSKKVSFMVVGDEPGPAKMEKGRTLGIKQISEDELLDMILVKSGLAPKYVKNDEVIVKTELPSPKKEESQVKIKREKTPIKEVKKEKGVNLKKLTEMPNKTNGSTVKREEVDVKQETDTKQIKIEKKKHDNVNKDKKETSTQVSIKTETPLVNLSWTEKYKPTDIRSIIGQQGDMSNMNKLLRWLQNWHKNHLGNNKPKLVKPSPWAKSDDGSYFKCALLSGPPGLGKTTTATLVAKHLGLDVVELNASDSRSKRLLHEEVSQLLSTKSISAYFKDGSAPTTKHVLLMDEVDGMAGNEDRGGMQELINLIKNTQVPIICMCNDRQHQKIRSLVNYCMDLRFTRPRVEQIKGAMMSVCFKEGLKISPDTLNEIIGATGMDIRQTLNNLSMWSSADKNITTEVGEKESKASKKDTPLGPWEVIRKVFSEDEHKKMNIGDRSRLFFYDYSIGPLFVQENYLQVVPHCPKKDVLERVAAAADSISMGDVIEKKIRSTNNWSLLESQAMYSSVLPGYYMRGHIGGQINFPSWLGKNSKRGKFQRLLSELQAHMRTSMSGSKSAVNLDYIYHLCNNIVRPLAKEGTDGIEKALEVMRSYHLLREDFDSILELCQWPKKKDPMAMVESKIKAAFTRAYNKQGPALPYSTNSVSKKKVSVAVQEENAAYGDEDGAESDNGEDEDISKDAMIKEKKKPAARGSKKDAGETSTKKKPSTRGRKK